MTINKNILSRCLALIMAVVIAVPAADACTSMLVGSKASLSGRPMLWKHRDTGTEHNFVASVTPKDGGHRYVGLYNGGDSLLTEAWAGFNDAGFAIINTASYNLAPDTATVKDREGIVMSLALARCVTVDDFAALLDALPKPMGVQANFGVMDANGNGAYFETDDHHYTRYNLGENPDDQNVIIRTNYSVSGNDTDGYGYIRHKNVTDLLAPEIAAGTLVPESFTEKCSRSFYNSLIGSDLGAVGHTKYVVDQDFIPRRISSASVVIEGLLPGESPDKMVMWTVIGYPPCSYVLPVMLDNVPDELLPTAEGFHSPLCDDVNKSKAMAFPIKRGSGSHYIDMEYINSVSPELRTISAENYARGRKFRENPSLMYKSGKAPAKNKDGKAKKKNNTKKKGKKKK